MAKLRSCLAVFLFSSLLSFPQLCLSYEGKILGISYRMVDDARPAIVITIDNENGDFGYGHATDCNPMFSQLTISEVPYIEAVSFMPGSEEYEAKMQHIENNIKILKNLAILAFAQNSTVLIKCLESNYFAVQVINIYNE